MAKGKLTVRVFILSCVNRQLSFKKHKCNKWSNWSEWIIINTFYFFPEIIAMYLTLWVTYGLWGFLEIETVNEVAKRICIKTNDKPYLNFNEIKSIALKSMRSWTRIPPFNSWFYDLSAVWPWLNYFIFLCLGLFNL